VGIVSRKIRSSNLILLVSVFLIAVNNFKYFSGVIDAFHISANLPFIISLAVWLFSILSLFLFAICNKYTIKPILITLLIISSFVNYFSSNFGIAIDDNMITNLAQTNPDESMDLVSLNMIYYFVIFGLLPSILVYKAKIIETTTKSSIFTSVKYLIIFLITFITITLLFSKSYTSLLREHRDLRFHINPMYWVYAVGKSINNEFNTTTKDFVEIGMDAKTVKSTSKRKVVVMVLGETVRADRFSLNGYGRNTNPLLAKEDVISFINMSSCGTDTAYSVPCMFSSLDKATYNHAEGKNMSNVLDIINRAGVKVIWLDNNSDSKGVADRIEYISYKSPDINSICDTECRDEGMVVDIEKYLHDNSAKDVLIILHEMGSHGPAYYKRYPERFNQFQPVCSTNQLNKCSNEQINNAYDNTILYTDFIMSEVIKLLKKNKQDNNAMFYMSDHGESLGEKGLYLHGMPSFIAPREQTHVSSVLWFGDNFKKKININEMDKISKSRQTHDGLFHTLLGLFSVKTSLYNKDLDLIPYK
jgi:lipid A ethanolaminephosphotransferase